MEAGIYHVASVGLPSIAILMTVGMMIGVWILAGIMPLLIYYGRRATPSGNLERPSQ